MELWAWDFPGDKSKDCFLISLLKGKIAKWSTSLLLINSQLLNNFAGFVAHVKAAFADPLKTENVNWNSWCLYQGESPVAFYITEFQLLV